MRDTDLYQHLLGLSPPWKVSKVELSLPNQQVDVWADHPKGLRWPCPVCGTESPLYDHDEERVWRHLDSCQFKTFLHARTPRVNCAEHGVRQVRLPWAEPNSRFTMMFERLAIDVLGATSVKDAAKILRISWDEAWSIMERAVKRGKAAKQSEPLTAISVDEKAIAKGHRYFTIVCNLEKSTVEFISDDRKKESLDRFYESLTPEQLAGIQGVAMDMWEPFFASTKAHVPQAEDKIVFDRFHIMKHMNEAVDEVRRREHAELARLGTSPLSRSKHLWLYAEENLPEKHRERFTILKESNLKTGRAWAIKESLRDLWEYPTLPEALGHWKPWYHWARCSRLPQVAYVAGMIKKRLHNVLTFISQPITTATSEGMNSRIETVKKRANGFRNKDHFRTAIFFHCGGLQLYPA